MGGGLITHGVAITQKKFHTEPKLHHQKLLQLAQFKSPQAEIQMKRSLAMCKYI